MAKPGARKHYEAGLRAERAGRWAQAARSYAACLDLAPTLAEAANNLGLCRLRMGQVEAAGRALRRAEALRPGDPVILGNLARWARARGDLDAAAAYLERRGGAAPDAATLRNLIGIRRTQGRDEDALDLSRRLRESGRASLADLSEFIHLARVCCDWAALEGLDAASLRARLAADPGYAGSPFRYYAHVGDPLLLREIAGRAATRAAQGAAPRAPAAPAAAPEGRLRVGVISQDLRDHPMLKLVAGPLCAVDPGRVALHVYALGPESDDPRRAALRAAAHRFAAFEAESDDAIADAIAGDRLDVLVDLMGYTRNARPGVLARRPCARQVAWLGLPGTTGAPFIDAVLADRTVLPPELEPAFSERPLRLSPCYYPFDDATHRPAAPMPRAEAGLPDDAVVLASFNQSFKLDPQRFETWCAALREVPGSVLWLMEPGDGARRRLRAFAEARGVSGERIVFAPRAEHEVHYQRLAAADLALDTRLYGGHTTTMDALWCGVPALTVAGPTFTSRVAASILQAAGLEGLVARDEAGHLETILHLAGDAAARAELRARVAALDPAAPPFGARAFARELEAALHGFVRG
jgi:predicted O-linked N-acetylglucosamine transferase (SPINDLY family)